MILLYNVPALAFLAAGLFLLVHGGHDKVAVVLLLFAILFTHSYKGKS
jgi:hypothetical protein